MSDQTEEFIGMAICCLIFLALSFYYKKNPPKKINQFYGFRTRRTMANKDIWEVANKRNAQDLWILSLFLTVVATLLWLFSVKYAMFIFLILLLGGLGVAVFSTVNYLDTYFDKNGNRK